MPFGQEVGFENRLGQLLQEQRHAVGLDDDLLDDLLGKLASRHALDQRRAQLPAQPAQHQGRDMRMGVPARLEFGARGDDDQDCPVLCPIDQEIDHLTGRRVDPVQILECDHQRLLARKAEEMIDQRRDGRILLLLRRQLQWRIAVTGRNGQQRGKQRRNLLDVAMSGSDRGLQARQRLHGRILAIETERVFELLGERIERRGGVIGRALERDLSMAVTGDPFEDFLDDARLADAGLAELDHDLALALLGLLPAPHQQRNLLLAVDERGQPRAHRGGEAGLHPRGAHHVPSLGLLRDALQRVDAEIAVVELPLQQRLGRRGNHHAVGRRQTLQPRGEIDGFSDRGVALFGALSDEVPNHDETGRDADADGG